MPTVKKGPKSGLTTEEKNSRRTFWGTIIAAVIGLTGIISAALINAGKKPTPSREKTSYLVRVTVLNPQGIPVVSPEGRPSDDVKVWADIIGAAQPAPGGWQFEIYPDKRPKDGKLILRAIKENAFLTGQTEIVLNEDLNPKATIQLKHDDSARVRGVVRDRKGNTVAVAQVWVGGHSEIVTTDAGGNFELAAHAAEGQEVHVYARKGKQKGDVANAIAGKNRLNEILVE